VEREVRWLNELIASERQEQVQEQGQEQGQGQGNIRPNKESS
jgi:hypothetical protein